MYPLSKQRSVGTAGLEKSFQARSWRLRVIRNALEMLDEQMEIALR